MRIARVVTAVLGLGAVAAAAQAGALHPGLIEEMDRSAPGTPLSVIVHLVDQAPVAALSQQLHARNATLRERHREIVFALQDETASQGDLKAALDQGIQRGDVLGYTSYWISNLLVVYATKEEIARIADRPDVDWVEPNFTAGLIEPVKTPPPPTAGDAEAPETTVGIGITPGVRAIRAPQVWENLGITGANRLVANLDTGVDGNHPALNTRWRGYNGQHPWQECWLDLLGTGTEFPTAVTNHGTHVMGTITGLGAATGDTIGVAWGAQWIACNSIGQSVGPEFDNDIITAFQWFADPDGNPETVDDVPDVIENSWRINEGFGYGYTDCDDRWWVVIDNCEAVGIVTVFIAGNEGDGSQTIGSPADRATTPTNTFSVGAVDATNYSWPYPIADFSSRGPTGCDVPADQKIKPEVVAPGVDVYSSIPEGGYQDGWDGTSMAGPHVAGVVALMRQANPNLDVDEIKQILMDTARDEGTAGEDNDYGWGFIDAYAAVTAATAGFGGIQGVVRNASWDNTPLADATIVLVDSGYEFTTDADGHYSGLVPPSTYTAVASRDGFLPDSTTVMVTASGVTIQNFGLTDVSPPDISDVSDPEVTAQTGIPYAIMAHVTDPSSVASVRLHYRIDGGDWSDVVMRAALGGGYSGQIPGMSAGTQIDYYVSAEDGLGFSSTSPEGAPDSFYTLYVADLAYDYQVEDPGDPNWQLGVPEDQADAGIWVRDDPVGTEYNGEQIQPEDDHTLAPGIKCFVTGNGVPGGAPGDADVDHGCTTLVSPVFDLSDATLAFVKYYRWYAEGGAASDDVFAVDVSSDGGDSWVPLERVADLENSWQAVAVKLNDLIPLTAQVQFRYQACDLNTQNLVEAAVDDFSILTFTPSSSAVPEADTGLVTSLDQNQPNPSRPATTIRFRLSNPAEAKLDLFDISGRRVRTLLEAPLQSGPHEVRWDGLDGQGNPAPAGVYFYRLKAGVFEQSRRMTILR